MLFKLYGWLALIAYAATIKLLGLRVDPVSGKLVPWKQMILNFRKSILLLAANCKIDSLSLEFLSSWDF
ncbi:MAG: hypothetical protein QW734_02590 [Candidatus Bathyarchaeia archaeon]